MLEKQTSSPPGCIPLKKGINVFRRAFANILWWYPLYVCSVITDVAYSMSDIFCVKKFDQYRSYKRSQGFTLIELSIVLVIISLLVGGVLVGQDLIKAAERRAFAKDMVEIATAANTFKLKYNCYAGDCPNATNFFGKNTTLCNSHAGTAASPGTCNGNGDKLPYSSGGNSDGSYFWHHLVLANLINYPYIENTSDMGYNYIFKNDHPYVSSNSNRSNIVLGVDLADFPLSELYFLDVSYDDGSANTGKIIVTGVGGSVYPTDPRGCIKADGNYADDIDISISGDECYVRIRTD